MKITAKLFLTLLSITSVVVVINFALARWSFDQGFREFINGLEQARLDNLSEQISNNYQHNSQSWGSLTQTERWLDWQPQPHPPPPRVHRPPQQEGPVRLPKPQLPHAIPVTVLLNAQGKIIAGQLPEEPSSSTMLSSNIYVQGKKVGELRTWPQIKSAPALATHFSRQQLWASLLIALLSLSLAGLISWRVAKRLLRPVKTILNGVSELNQGHYPLEFEQHSQDELGILQRNIENLSHTLAKNRSAKSRLFADISHELRTPLTILNGEIEVLKAGLRPLNQQQLHSFEQEVNLLTHLVDDLYQLSLSDVGGLRYQFAQGCLADCLHSALDTMSTQAQKKGISIERKICNAAPCLIDKARIEQLLLNLLSNAIAYTDAPGKIIIELHCDDQQIHLRIQDTAPGVTAYNCQRLFEPLFRQDVSRTRRGSGAGLGLTIAKNIVTAHQGDIHASPSSYGGVCITLNLALNRESNE